MPKRSSLLTKHTKQESDSVSPSVAALTTPQPYLPSTFTDGLPLPRVLVFDLDFTLWPFWVDTHVAPPLKAGPLSMTAAWARNTVKDAHGDTFAFYTDVPGILSGAQAHGLKLAGASRTCAPDLAMQMLRLLQVRSGGNKGSENGTVGGGGEGHKPAIELFDNLQIYPGDKVAHLKGIQKALGVPYEDMVFFDDEERNRNVERELWVCFWLVRDGITKEEVDRGVKKWRQNRGVNGASQGETGGEDEWAEL